jgi:hypothetical protein
MLSQPIVAIKHKQFLLLLSLPSNNLETDHKENTSRGVYRVFPSGFTISIIYFNTLYFGRLYYLPTGLPAKYTEFTFHRQSYLHTAGYVPVEFDTTNQSFLVEPLGL